MTQVILFVFGLVLGSFLNVVASRWGSELKPTGRSRCLHCGTQLRWFELIPLASFFLQLGKCRTCGQKISWQYPLVEIWTGLVFMTIPLVFLPVFCIYIVIAIYDFHTKIIPDPLVLAAILLSALVRLWMGGSLLDWLAGPLLFLFFASIWLFSRGRAMGFGDAKLGLSIGLLSGGALGFSGIILGFWIGAAYALIYTLLNKSGFLSNGKELTMKSEVPFAPFMILGVWASLLFNLDLLHVALF